MTNIVRKWRELVPLFLLMYFFSCNPKIDIPNSSSCNFPLSASNLGYGYYKVGNQYFDPNISNGKVILNFENLDSTYQFGILSVIDSTNKNFIYNQFVRNLAASDNCLLYTDYATNQTRLHVFKTGHTSIIENDPKRWINYPQFNQRGSLFLYKCEKPDLSKSVIIIRDTLFNFVDSITYFQYGNFTWTNIIWVNDSLLAFSFSNDQYIGIKLFNLLKRSTETIFQTDYKTGKNTITSVMWSASDNSVYYTDGLGVHKINLNSKQQIDLFSSCDSKEYVAVSPFDSKSFLSEIIFRKKINETRINEKHSIYIVDAISLRERLFLE